VAFARQGGTGAVLWHGSSRERTAS